MAIIMRKGLLADFNPAKMLAGEWAVTIDPETKNQIVYMCFGSGMVKRMGTLDDFEEWFQREFSEAITPYEAEFNAIKAECRTLISEAREVEQQVIIIRDSIVNTYIPQIEALVAQGAEIISVAQESADEAKDAKDWIENNFNIDITKKSSAGVVDTYDITYQNDKHFEFNVTNGEQGPQGPQGNVGPAGPAGPQGPVGPQGPKGAGATTWDELTDKPFNSIDNETVIVEDGVLKATAKGGGGGINTSTGNLEDSIDGNIRALHLLGEGHKSRNLVNFDDFNAGPSATYKKLGKVSVPAGTYTFSWTQDADIEYAYRNTPYYINQMNGQTTTMSNADHLHFEKGRYSWTMTFTTPMSIEIYYNCPSLTSDVNYVDFMFEEGDVAHDYEPMGLFVSEGIVESAGVGQASSINASAILNSTFAGAGDIHDEVIVNADKTGVFIKRVNVSVTDVTPLDTPVQRDLTPTEVAQFLSLKTYKPLSTITSDCGHEIEYYAGATGEVIIDLEAKTEQLNNSADDEGKVFTANGDGTASWKEAQAPISFNADDFSVDANETVSLSQRVTTKLQNLDENGQLDASNVKYGDTSVSEELQKGDVYSTNETPIGTWIDGRTIYRKVIREFTLGNGSISTPASVSLPHGASVSTFIRVYGMAYNASNPATVRPLPFAGASTTPTTKSNEIRIDASTSNIVITVYENWSAYKAFAVIEYVK